MVLKGGRTGLIVVHGSAYAAASRHAEIWQRLSSVSQPRRTELAEDVLEDDETRDNGGFENTEEDEEEADDESDGPYG